LRDDFISNLVRGCWMVSFICTPIYMFTVTYIVSFGPKKGNLSAYAGYWYANFKSSLQLLTTYFNHTLSFSNINWRLLFRFQFTIITSRTTTYVLFIFWCFFFFFGEFLLLIMFNFNTVSDLIPSHFFISTKNHVIFWLNNGSAKLSESIMIYIIFLSLCSFNFLLRLDLNFSPTYLRSELNSDLVFMTLFVFYMQSGLIALAMVLYWATLRVAK
jgi:hypothetical protein